MEEWKKNARKEPVITDLDTLVPADHLLRKIEKVMDANCNNKLDTPWQIASAADGAAGSVRGRGCRSCQAA